MIHPSRLELVPASPAHIGTIAARMREWDRIECQAQGHTPKGALRVGLRASLSPITAKLDGRPEAMFGLYVVNALGGVGAPWMLGTDAIYRRGRDLLAFGPTFVDAMLDSMPVLQNVVAEGNERAIALLRRWGFGVGSEREVIGGVSFRRFTKVR